MPSGDHAGKVSARSGLEIFGSVTTCLESDFVEHEVRIEVEDTSRIARRVEELGHPIRGVCDDSSIGVPSRIRCGSRQTASAGIDLGHDSVTCQQHGHAFAAPRVQNHAVRIVVGERMAVDTPARHAFLAQKNRRFAKSADVALIGSRFSGRGSARASRGDTRHENRCRLARSD